MPNDKSNFIKTGNIFLLFVKALTKLFRSLYDKLLMINSVKLTDGKFSKGKNNVILLILKLLILFIV
jgi:hypothetical protein